MTVPPVVPAALCDRCSRWADTAHLLPYVTEPRTVELSCPRHRAGGYTVELDEWGQPADDEAWAHLASKRNGLIAVGMLALRLAQEEGRRAAAEAEHRPDGHPSLWRTAGELLELGHARKRAFELATRRAGR